MRANVLLAAVSVFAVVSSAQAAEVTQLQVPDLPLKQVTYPNGKTMDLTVGFGSGAFHHAGDAENVFYTITDRGPNIDCSSDADELIGLGKDKLCGGNGDAKIFPVPEFTPTIYAMKIADDGKVAVTSTTPLRGSDGQLLNGLSNPLITTNTEGAYSADGDELDKSADGFDAEGIVKMDDGSYWIGEEYGASIAHVAADGKVLERLVPEGLEDDYKGASYPVKGVLPAIIMKRHLNRGIESMAAAPDGSALYFAMQSPLDNPDADAYKSSRVIRIFKFDPKAGKVVGEYAYHLDDASSFKADNTKKKAKPTDVKISELSAVGNDQLLVLERISKTTKFYRVDLSGAKTIPASLDKVETKPSLETMSDDELQTVGVETLKKRLVLDSDDLPDMPEKIEGVAVMDPKTLVLVTDNDFGIAGDKSHIVRVSLDQPL